MLYLFLILFGMILGTRFPYVLTFPIDYWKGRKLLKSLTPTKADQEKLCKSPHIWLKANGLSAKGPTAFQVCSVCGLVGGTDTVLSPEAIDRIEDKNRVLEIENRLLKEFMQQEDDEIKEYFEAEIKSGVNFDKLAAIHTAGMTFNNRFWVYKAAKSKEIQEELSRSNA